MADDLSSSGRSLCFQGTVICLYGDVSPWTPELVDQGQRAQREAVSAELALKI